MKKLRRGALVLIEARDWMGNSSWQTPEERDVPAPLGCVMGIVDSQDDTTLSLSVSWFLDDPADLKDGGNKIPVGCIEAVYELVVRREPLWRKKKRETRRQADKVQE
ncbi:MAG: hypothetical protein GY832_11525 [Chloroflexi bacterium]|nr:hypothetical protein [Chloroflexota bacterium]